MTLPGPSRRIVVEPDREPEPLTVPVRWPEPPEEEPRPTAPEPSAPAEPEPVAP